MNRYERLAAEIAALVEAGVLRPGEKIPSSRTLARTRGVSLSTVMQACQLLEARGVIQARPRSGFYVNAHWKPARAEPSTVKPPATAAPLDVSELVFEVLGAARQRSVVPLGSAFPSPDLFPLAKLAQLLGQRARKLDPWRTVEDISPGSLELRRQIARRYSMRGIRVLPDEIVITAGALEGLNLCLESVTRAGDVVVVESPAFYGALQAVERLGLRAVEVATHPSEGADLGSLEAALKKHDVKACWLMPTFQNPTGATMPEAKKRELVKLLAKHGVPLIEDDVYTELHFGTDPLPPAKAFDEAGLVMHCGSFAKCLAPGYRLGWCVPGRAMQQVERLKLTTSIATSLPVQEAIAEYLRQGGYDRHLRTLRAKFAAQQATMLAAIEASFPRGTTVTRPPGGYFLWADLPNKADALAIHRAALKKGIGIAPGPIFSARRRFESSLRINYGHPWSAAMESAIATLGKLSAPPGNRTN